MISQYFVSFDAVINKFDFIISSDIKKRKINDFLGIVEGEIIIETGVLYILEVIQVKEEQLSKKKYKYHFILKDALCFRYDNAAHHFDIETFPHHKHLPDSIIPTKEPSLLQVLLEMKKILSYSK